MIEVRGKFLLMANSLMEQNFAAKEAAQKVLLEKTGKTIDEVRVDDWYDSELYQSFLDAYCRAHTGQGKSKEDN